MVNGSGLGDGERALCEIAKYSAMEVVSASGVEIDDDFSRDGETMRDSTKFLRD